MSGYVAYYDFFADFDHDVPFYRSLAVEAGGEVLELGCGTGRVAIPLAQAGVGVAGVDLDRAMLGRALEAANAAGVAGRITLVEGDMTRVAIDRRFPLAICPANTLLCLRTRTAQEMALANAFRHLEPGGRLALDVFHPATYLADHPADGVRRVLKQGVHRASGRTVRWSASVRHAVAAQVLLGSSEIEVFDGKGGVERHPFEETLRYCHRAELELLCEKAGFEIESVHGGFDRRTFDDTSRKIVLVARRPARPT